MLGVLALLFVPRLLEARRQLTFARSDLQGARTAVVLRSDDEARESLGQARKRLADVQRHARGFPLGLTRPVPLLGSPSRALDDAARAGMEAVAAGDAIVRAGTSFPDSGPVAVTGQDLSGFHAAAVDAGHELDQAQLHLEAARQSLEGPTGALLPPVSGPARAMLQELEHGHRQLVGARRGITLLTDLVGPQADVRLLLLAQDSLELRPTGGYIGSFGVLRFFQGTVALERYQATEDLPAPEPPMKAPGQLAPLLPGGWRLSNVNWWPDFPTTASTATEMFKRQGGGEVNGVLAVTEHAIARLIGALGPLQVPGYAEPVVEKGFDERVVREVELKRPLDIPRKRFLIELSKVVFGRLFNLPGERLPGVTQAIDRSVGVGDLQVWFADPARQRHVVGTRWSGALPSVDHDFLMLADVNLSASKANLGVVKDVTYRVRRQGTDGLVAEVKVAIRNEGRETPVNPLYNSFLRVYVPRDAELVDPDKDQYDDGEAPDGRYRVFSQYFIVDPGSEATATFRYRLPEGVAPDGKYRLTWVRQVGTPGDSLVAVVPGRTTESDPGNQVLEVRADVRGNRVVEFLRRRWVVRKLTG